MAAVNAKSTVGAVCQPSLCPSTGNIDEEDGPNCGLIHRERLCDRWSCREEVRKGVRPRAITVSHTMHMDLVYACDI